MKTTKLIIAFMCFFGLMEINAQIPSYVPKDSLVGWWPFNGNVNDESGNGNHGTIVNKLQDTTDRFGNYQSALSFDGSGYITIFKINNLLYKPVTFSGWLKVSNYLAGNGGFNCKSIIGRNRGFEKNCGEICLASINGKYSNELTFWRGGGTSTLTNAAKSFPLDSWTNFVFTYNTNGNFQWYINGELTNTGNFTELLNYYADFMIGSDNNNTGSSVNWDGLMDDIGIWNRVLDSNEIQKLYAANTCQEDSITKQITDIKSNSGKNVMFQAEHSDTMYTATWQSKHVDMRWNTLDSNTTYNPSNKSLMINNVSVSNHNQTFRVILNKNNCYDTSKVATLSISDTCINMVFDTIRTTIYDTIAVQDTLIINAKLTGTTPLQTNLIKVYPNPAKDNLVIDFGNYSSMAGYEINIFDVAGKSVYSSTINKSSETIDLNTWTGKGVYFIKINDKLNQQIENRKIVIQ